MGPLVIHSDASTTKLACYCWLVRGSYFIYSGLVVDADVGLPIFVSVLVKVHLSYHH